MTSTAVSTERAEAPRSAAAPILSLETPFGRPVSWAQIALVTDVGDSHALNDDRSLVVTCRDLGQRANGPWREYMLCLLADGATGSTFGRRTRSHLRTAEDPSRQAGWRASQLAQAAFVERFMTSHEVDILERLKDGLRAADRALTDSSEGTLSTTLVALFLAADGTAYAASIGDSVLLVFAPRKRAPGDRRLKKLGYEESTSVGSGDTTLHTIDESQLIEQWWPHKEGGGSGGMRVEPGTFLVLLSDGISDNLPVDVVEQLLRRHPLDRAVISLPVHTRERRAETRKREGGSTQQLGLDNMSAVAVRFDGSRLGRAAASMVQEATLVSVLGTSGGPACSAGAQFGMICLAGQEDGATVVPGFLRHFIESEHIGDIDQRLASSFAKAMPRAAQTRFAVAAVDGNGSSHTYSSGGARVGPLS